MKQVQLIFLIDDEPTPTKKIILNSFSDILKFCSLYSGIFLYRLKYSIQSLLFNGGNKPVNNSQLVIDSPESVSLVKPPIKIIRVIRDNNDNNQNLSKLFD